MGSAGGSERELPPVKPAQSGQTPAPSPQSSSVDARRWIAIALAAVHRLGGNDEIEAWIKRDEAWIDYQEGKAAAAHARLQTHVTEYALVDANRALADLREGRIEGAAVLVP